MSELSQKELLDQISTKIADVDFRPHDPEQHRAGIAEILEEEDNRVKLRLVVPLQWKNGRPFGITDYFHEQWYPSDEVFVSPSEECPLSDVASDRQAAMREHQDDLLRDLERMDGGDIHQTGRFELADGTVGFGERMDTKCPDTFGVRWISLVNASQEPKNANMLLSTTEYHNDMLRKWEPLEASDKAVRELRLESLIQSVPDILAYEASVKHPELSVSEEQQHEVLSVSADSVHDCAGRSNAKIVELPLKDQSGKFYVGAILVSDRNVEELTRTRHLPDEQKRVSVSIRPDVNYAVVAKDRDPVEIRGLDLVRQVRKYQSERTSSRVQSLISDYELSKQDDMQFE